MDQKHFIELSKVDCRNLLLQNLALQEIITIMSDCYVPRFKDNIHACDYPEYLIMICDKICDVIKRLAVEQID